MSTNGDGNKLKITCPNCGQVFSHPMAAPEISNGLRSSVVSISHERIVRCANAKCSTPFVVVVTGVQLVMGAQPVDESVASQAGGSPIIKPTMSLVEN